MNAGMTNLERCWGTITVEELGASDALSSAGLAAQAVLSESLDYGDSVGSRQAEIRVARQEQELVAKCRPDLFTVHFR